MNSYPSKELTDSLSEESLILRLKSAEHDFVERKPRSPKGEWLQAAVAFANSAPIGWPAVLFVGVDDKGKPQQGPDRLEDLMKSVSAILDQAYPPIYRHLVPIHISETEACLAVIVPGSDERPHFAGKPYVRRGPSTTEASPVDVNVMSAGRSPFFIELSRHVGEHVTCRVWRQHTALTLRSLSEPKSPPTIKRKIFVAALSTVTPWFLTVLPIREKYDDRRPPESYPLTRVEISFDDQNDRLALEINDYLGTGA